MSYIKSYFKDWTLFEKIWLTVSTILVLALSAYWQDTIIGVTCSITGLWCVILVAKGRIANYYIGIINIILYAFISYGYQYYGEVMLNAFYFLPMQFIGLWMWTRGKNKRNSKEIKIAVMSKMGRVCVAILSSFAVLFYGLFLQSLGGALPFIDSMSTVLSVVAMLLMVFRFAEQWVLWIIVDVVTVILWFVVMANGGNDISILLMWVAYLVNAVYGLINWIKLYRTQEA